MLYQKHETKKKGRGTYGVLWTTPSVYLHKGPPGRARIITTAVVVVISRLRTAARASVEKIQGPFEPTIVISSRALGTRIPDRISPAGSLRSGSVRGWRHCCKQTRNLLARPRRKRKLVGLPGIKGKDRKGALLLHRRRLARRLMHHRPAIFRLDLVFGFAETAFLGARH